MSDAPAEADGPYPQRRTFRRAEKLTFDPVKDVETFRRVMQEQDRRILIELYAYGAIGVFSASTRLDFDRSEAVGEMVILYPPAVGRRIDWALVDAGGYVSCGDGGELVQLTPAELAGRPTAG